MADLALLGENIDRLITVDIGGRGIVHTLYDAAREISGAPLTLNAAQALHSAVGVGDNVLITTGFPIPPTMAPETDGPLGALILSKTLRVVLHAKAIILAEKKALDLTAKLAKLIGMTTASPEKRSQEDEIALLSFPLKENNAVEYSIRTIKEFNPSVILAVEKVGGNRKGIYHNMRGNNISNSVIKVDHLFSEAEKMGVLTIGVGDGGNEIGMGQITEAVMRHVPYGAMCHCPCKAGIACQSKTDHLVIASVSNWGAYGIAAFLSAITEQTEGLHTGDGERILLLEASKNGAVDGVTGKNTPSVDGLAYRVHANIVELLRDLVGHSI